MIAHGVYSWVPQAVRERLLWLARRVLKPAGVLYLSYNTRPGWRMRGMLRDILLDAGRDQTEPQARLTAAQGALARLTAGLDGLPGEAARYLREEARRLAAAPPSYLYFEFLAEHNHPVLFRDFVADAESAGLRYLCDSDLQTLFPASLGNAADSALADLTDGVDLEQWLDFLSSRNFRQSLLIRSDLVADETLSLEHFAEFAFSADLMLPRTPRLGNQRPTDFIRPGDETLAVCHPLSKAVLLALANAYPAALSLPTLLGPARQSVRAAGAADLADDVDGLLAELFAIFAQGAIGAHLAERRAPVLDRERPRALDLVRVLAAQGLPQVPTRDHGNLDLDPVAAQLLARLDGDQTVAALAVQMAADGDRLADQSGPRPPAPGGKRGGRSETKQGSRAQDAEARVLGLLALFERYGLLAPAAPA